MRRTFAVVLVLLTAMTAGCAQTPPTVNELLRALPTRVGGVAIDEFAVIDGSFSTGHSVDDVLDALGRKRSDLVAVFGGPTRGAGGVGAVSVQGVGGERLVHTIVANWNRPSVVDREQLHIGGRGVWLLTERSGYETAVYHVGDVAYIAHGHTRTTVENYLEAFR